MNKMESVWEYNNYTSSSEPKVSARNGSWWWRQGGLRLLVTKEKINGWRGALTCFVIEPGFFLMETMILLDTLWRVSSNG
tara:strand:- start:6 stop:245 length:240 start_codon:yes stop_codon:yes gene_type:complete